MRRKNKFFLRIYGSNSRLLYYSGHIQMLSSRWTTSTYFSINSIEQVRDTTNFAVFWYCFENSSPLVFQYFLLIWRSTVPSANFCTAIAVGSYIIISRSDKESIFKRSYCRIFISSLFPINMQPGPRLKSLKRRLRVALVIEAKKRIERY